MKRITSSLLALLLALSMLIGMVPAVYATDYTDTIESIGSTETADSSETEAVSDDAEDVAVYAAANEAMIGDQAYPTLQDAINAAKTGDTITLLKDGTLGSDITKGVTIVGQEVAGVKPVISAKYWYKADNLTLKNVKLVRPDRLGIENASNVAFENCEITRASATSEFALVDVKSTAKNVTFTDCVFDSLGQASVIYAQGKNITLNNCQLKNAYYGIYCDRFSGKMTVNKCTFTNLPTNVARKTEDSATAEFAFNDCNLAGYFGFKAGEKAEFKNCKFTKASKMDNNYNADWNQVFTCCDISFDKCSFTEDYAGKFYVSVDAVPTTVIALTGCTVVDENGAGSNNCTVADLASTNMTTGENASGILAIDATTDADGKIVSGKLVGHASNIDNAVAEGSDYDPETGTVTSGSSTTGVATVGENTYNTLEEAINALSDDCYTLTLINGNAWDAATPVYWAAGTQSGYAAKLTDALTAAYKVGEDNIKIVCRPGADVGTMTHGHVADNVTIYGNNAYISGGECDLEVDTYMFSRETGKLVTADGACLDKNITITAYELDNLGVWGERHTAYTVNVNLIDCDGNAVVTPNPQRVYISGTTGDVNINLNRCDFITNNTAAYSNANGTIVIEACTFTGSKAPVNFNHKADGSQTLTVSDCKFTGCGDDGEWKQFAAPVRFVNSGSGTQSATVGICTFEGTVGSNGDILIGDGRTGEKSNEVSLTVMNTDATVQAQKPGYYNGAATDKSKGAEKKVTSDKTLNTSVEEMLPTALTAYVTVNGGTEQYATLDEAIAAAEPENGVITYTVTGKVNANGESWIQVAKAGLTGLTEVKFVGADENAEICITNSTAVLADQSYDIDVSFKDLTLSHPNGAWVGDLGHATNYFTTVLRNPDAANNTVSYTNCTFPNGACNNQYGKTVYANCNFTNATSGKYNLWNYGGNTEIKNSTFTGTRGIKAYSEGTDGGDISISGTTFDDLNEKTAIVASKPVDIVLDNVVVTGDSSKGLFTRDISGKDELTISATGTGISGTFNILNDATGANAKEELNISAGTFNSEVSSDYCADGFEVKDNGDGTYGVAKAPAAKIGEVEYETLDKAIEAVQEGETIIVNAGEYKLNGSLTYTGKAFTIKAAGGAKVSFDMSAAVALHGAKITFENVTFDYKTNGNYIGMQHTDTLVYNNCTINGMVFLYAASETFNFCTFKQSSKDAYNVWTYGAKNVVFNSCTFECVGKSVLVYNEGTNTKTDLKVKDSTFIASAPVDGKAAIEIDTSLMPDGTTITIEGTTTATGFAKGSKSGDTLWNDKMQDAENNKNTTVVVNGETVFAPKASGGGTEDNPYTLAQLGAMTRAEYVEAQTRLGGTMYVTVGDYKYDKNGVLGNGERNDTPGQTPDHSKLNAYGENGYLGEKNDGANGKNIVFVGGTITSGVTGYESIDNIGTSLLLAVPAYTNVTFKGITFNNVMSFDYQLYTSPWSQLGALKFDGCTFNGIIVGAIAAQTLTFDKCEFTDYTNTVSANSSNPTWIRPAYGNWTKGDNEGQGSEFRSLTEINFTGNTVTSTRPVKFERIAQWEMDTTVTATGNTFTISKQEGDTSTKNVGLYFGANAKFDLIADNNNANAPTAGLYTGVYSAPDGVQYAGLPAGSTVKDSTGKAVELEALTWKDAEKLTFKTTEELASVTNAKGTVVNFASLSDAIAAAKDGDTVTLLKSCNGNGIKIETENFATKGLTVDFGGHTYSVGGVLVGSPGTGTSAFQLLQGGKVTFQNGTIAGVTKDTKPAEDTPNWRGAPAIVIQNYCDLTLKNMTITGGDETVYTMSNNHGDIVIEDTAITAGGAKGYGSGPFAFDVCGYSSYTGVSVTVRGKSTINGDIEVSRSNANDVKLTLESGTINGKLKIDESIKPGDATTITKTADVTLAAPDGYEWSAADENGNATLFKPVAQIGKVNYASLKDAYDAAADGKTIKLLADCESERINLTKNIEVNLNGHTLKSTSAYGVMFCARDGYKIKITGKTEGSKLIGTVMVTANTNGKIELNGGTYENEQYCPVYINGQSTEGTQLTVSNAAIIATNASSTEETGVGVYLAGECTTKFTNTTITAPVTALEIRAGQLTLKNCNLTGGKGTLSAGANGNGSTVANAALAISQHTTQKNIQVTVIGGTYEATAAIYQSAVQQPIAAGSVKAEVISGTFKGEIKAVSQTETEKVLQIKGGTFDRKPDATYIADGYECNANTDGTYGVQINDAVASVNGVTYAKLQAAIDAAPRKGTVKLLADTRENVTIGTPDVTLDLNGFTLNGSTGERKPALTVTARVTVKDSSEAQTGTIMREDTAENSGVSSHYVIDIQGSGWLTFESGNVKNESGNAKGKGASLVRVGDDSVAKFPGLNIKGGTFTQDNFIVIKVDRGDLFLNGGTLNCANSYAVENWHRATIKGGTVNGNVSSWTYSGGSNSTLEISGGTVNGDVESVSYDGTEGKLAKVEIMGGTVNGTLSTKRYDDSTTTPGKDMATIEVTAGTFSKDPSEYLVEGSTVTNNSDGTFGVEKAYLAQVGENSYYTMDEAFKAQTASGKPIVLLRDYTTGSTFNSGTINRTVDLNGHTWTCTGTDANSAAFEINNPNVTLTVKNGKIVSSQLVGLIPSAMGGTIKYDNSGLVFEGVEMSTTATSGIETNGNNTNDSVTLRNSTLNVPNGFGIYFPSSGTLTIENSKINAKTMGVQVCAGSLSINEGSAITVSDGPVDKTENDGAIQDGAAISIVNRTGYKGLGTITVTGGTFNAKTGNDAIKAYNWENNTETKFTEPTKVGVSGGTFSAEVPADLCADGFIPTKNADGTYGVKEGTYVAAIGENKYATLAAAVDAAKDGDTITLLANVTENVEISEGKRVTLDLNGYTLNGGTGTAKAALTNYGTITIKDSSAAKTGTIKRDDNGTVGETSYYVIRNQGTMTIENGTVINNSGYKKANSTGSMVGSSLICNGDCDEGGTLTIKGGTFTQNNFIAIKNGALGVLHVTGGTITSNHSAIQNWFKADITGGEIKGQLWTDAWKEGESVGETQIGGDAKFTGEIVMDITGSVAPTLAINGGNLNVTNWRITSAAANAGAKPAVSGGTFSSAVKEEYCAPGYVPKNNGDGTYGVEESKPIEVWTGYTGTKVASYKTIAEAAANLGNNKWIVIAKDYTLDENFTIGGEGFDNLYLDVAKGATLTVAEGVTLTVAANAKRLGVRDDATVVNNGTILVCGSSNSNGFAMLYGTFTGNELTVPEGYFLDNNGKNYFATADTDAVYEITYTDGTVKKTADSTNITNIKGGNIKQIKLLLDVTKGGFTFDKNVGSEVTLDLNGHTLSYDGANPNYATLNIYTKVTIKHGTVEYTGTKRGAIDLVGQGDLTIESDVTINGGDAFAIFTSGTSKLTVNGTVKANGYYAIAGNGSKDAGGYIDSCDITINDGAVISAPNGIAIYHPEKGTVTVNGGTISGNTGIEMCAGKLVVNAGSITSTGNNVDATGSQNAILDGAAISIINRNYPGGVPTAEITGGTFKATGKNAQTVKAYDYTNNVVADWKAAGEYVNISGGTFSSIPANMDALCADGYAPVDKGNGTYTVDKISTEASYIDANGKLHLGLLKELLYMSDSKGMKLTIYKDIEIDYVVLLNDRELNLNGHKLTVKDTFVAVTGSVKDTEDGKGLIKIDAKNLHLAPENGNVGQIPLYDAEKGGYRLFNCEMVDMKTGDAASGSLTIYFTPKFTNKEAYDLLLSKNAHNAKITITIRWTSIKGPGEQSFTFDQDLVDKVVGKNNVYNGGNQVFFITLTGLDADLLGTISGLKSQSGITSGTGASFSGVELSLN